MSQVCCERTFLPGCSVGRCRAASSPSRMSFKGCGGAKRQFLWMPDSQFLAERNDSVECLDAEIHPLIQVAQSLVLRYEPVLIQRPKSHQEPAVAGRQSA